PADFEDEDPFGVAGGVGVHVPPFAPLPVAAVDDAEYLFHVLVDGDALKGFDGHLAEEGQVVAAKGANANLRVCIGGRGHGTLFTCRPTGPGGGDCAALRGRPGPWFRILGIMESTGGGRSGWRPDPDERSPV